MDHALALGADRSTLLNQSYASDVLCTSYRINDMAKKKAARKPAKRRAAKKSTKKTAKRKKSRR